MQVADARSDELVIGAGYRFDNVQIIVRSGGAQKALKSDLNVRLDLSIRDNKTLARKLDRRCKPAGCRSESIYNRSKCRL